MQKRLTDAPPLNGRRDCQQVQHGGLRHISLPEPVHIGVPFALRMVHDKRADDPAAVLGDIQSAGADRVGNVVSGGVDAFSQRSG